MYFGLILTFFIELPVTAFHIISMDSPQDYYIVPESFKVDDW